MHIFAYILHIFAYILHRYVPSAYLSYYCIFTYFAYCIYFAYDCILILAAFGDSEDEDNADPESGATAAEDALPHYAPPDATAAPGPSAKAPAPALPGFHKMHIYAYEHILFQPGRRLFKPGRRG